MPTQDQLDHVAERTAQPRGLHTRARTACLILLSIFSSLTYSQTLTVEASANREAFKPSFVLSNVRYEGVRLNFRAAGVVSGPLEVGFGARYNTSFGPVGNVTIEGRGDVDTAGDFSINARGQGTITQVSVRAELQAFSVNPGHFELREAFPDDARPRHAQEVIDDTVGFGLTGGVTYRLTRTEILEADANVRYLTRHGFGVNVRAGLQLRNLIASDTGVVRVQADLGPGARDGYGAAGFEYRLSRRGLPVVRASAWLGVGTLGFWPGVRASISHTVDPVTYQLELAAEPFRTDALRYRFRGDMRVALNTGELGLELLAAPASDLPVVTASVRYSVSF